MAKATKLKKVLKREIVSIDEGLTLGTPTDILIDPEQHRVAVVVLTAGAVPETSVVAYADAIQSFDSDTLAIRSINALRLAAHDDEARQLLHRGLHFRDHPVLTSTGAKLGRIRNVLIDHEGQVVEYRIRRRPLGFLRRTLRITPTDLRTSGGQVAVIFPPSNDDTPCLTRNRHQQRVDTRNQRDRRVAA
jgi:sporulation protein YlmC with PRC-barrel domain